MRRRNKTRNQKEIDMAWKLNLEIQKLIAEMAEETKKRVAESDAIAAKRAAESDAIVAKMAAENDRRAAENEAIFAKIVAENEKRSAERAAESEKRAAENEKRAAESEKRAEEDKAKLAKMTAENEAIFAKIATENEKRAAERAAKREKRAAEDEAKLAKMTAENDRRAADIEKEAAESAKSLAELKQQIKSVSTQFGGMCNSNGSFAEDIFYNSLESSMQFAGQHYDIIDQDVNRKINGVRDQFDIIMYNGASVVIGEFYINDLGEFTDPDGIALTRDDNDDPDSTYSSASGKTYQRSELPLHVIQRISYVDWDFEAIDNINTEIKNAITNSTYNFASFVPNTIELPFKQVVKTAGPPVVYEGPNVSNYYSVTVVETGWYEIDLYGASGGHEFTRSAKTALGGKGGHVKATVKLTKGDVLKVFVGGEGQGSGKRDGDNIVQIEGNVAYPGGFPNGGNGAEGKNGQAPSGSGGGSTEVHLFGTYVAGTNNLTNSGAASAVYDGTTTRDNRLLLVAGGGGGGSQCGGIGTPQFWPGLRGGSAGPATLTESTDSPKAAAGAGVRQGYNGGGNLWNATPTEANYNFKTYKFNGAAGDVRDKVYSMVKPAGEPEEFTGQVMYWGRLDGRQQPGVTTTGIGHNAEWPNGGIHEPSGGGGGGYRGGDTGHTGDGIIGISSGGGGTNFIKNDSGTVRDKAANGTNPNYGNGSATIKWIGEN